VPVISLVEERRQELEVESTEMKKWLRTE